MSGGSERYLLEDINTEQAIGRLRDHLATPWPRSVVFEVLFEKANTPRDIQHGMGVTPTGVVLLAVVGGNVRCSDLTTWTPELAFLQADAANVRARLYFVQTEVPINA
jgi:hypothetical protein